MPDFGPADDKVELSRLGDFVPPLLSVIAGMVDLFDFFTIGNIFTTHIIGNLVLASATAVRGRPWRFRPSSLLWRLPGASHTSRTSTARPAHGVQFVLLVAVLIFGVSRGHPPTRMA
jgi:hypothetical protein